MATTKKIQFTTLNKNIIDGIKKIYGCKLDIASVINQRDNDIARLEKERADIIESLRKKYADLFDTLKKDSDIARKKRGLKLDDINAIIERYNDDYSNLEKRFTAEKIKINTSFNERIDKIVIASKEEINKHKRDINICINTIINHCELYDAYIEYSKKDGTIDGYKKALKVWLESVGIVIDGNSNIGWFLNRIMSKVSGARVNGEKKIASGETVLIYLNEKKYNELFCMALYEILIEKNIIREN